MRLRAIAFGLLLLGLDVALFPASLFCAEVAAQTGEKSGDAAKEKEALPDKAAVPNIPGIAKSLTGRKGSRTRGKRIAINPMKGNCLACHAITVLSDAPFHGTIGPKLDGVAARYTEAQLRQMIADARVFFPTTTMPPYFVSEGFYRVEQAYQDKTILTAGDVEDLVAFLKTLR